MSQFFGLVNISHVDYRAIHILLGNQYQEGKFVTGKDGKKRRRRARGTPPPGRPPRHPGERLSKNRTFRVRGGLDKKLQAAAAVSGRSVSEEIEFRLDQSFDRVRLSG